MKSEETDTIQCVAAFSSTAWLAGFSWLGAMQMSQFTAALH